MTYERIVGGQKSLMNYPLPSSLFGILLSTSHSLTLTTIVYHIESQPASTLATGLTRMWTTSGYGGLCPWSLEYINTTVTIFLYSKRRYWRFYYSNLVKRCPIALVAPISVSTVANSYKIEVQALRFNILTPFDVLSDFKDASSWDNLIELSSLTNINSPSIIVLILWTVLFAVPPLLFQMVLLILNRQ